MNLILFHPHELEKPILRADRRYKHLKRVLKVKSGDRLRAGILNGPPGEIHIVSADAQQIVFTFKETGNPLKPLPIDLFCGLSRPQQVKRILRDCTSMGVSSIRFFPTENGEKSFVHSPIWTGNTLDNLVIEGLEQAGITCAPTVQRLETFNAVLELIHPDSTTIILDNATHLPSFPDLLASMQHQSISILIGSERGWTETERARFLKKQLVSAHMGNRILRTDTACISAVALASAAFF